MAQNHWPPKRMDGLSMFKSCSESCYNQSCAKASQIQLVLGGITLAGPWGHHPWRHRWCPEVLKIRLPAAKCELSRNPNLDHGLVAEAPPNNGWFISPSKWLLVVNKPFQGFLDVFGISIRDHRPMLNQRSERCGKLWPISWNLIQHVIHKC